MNYRKPKWNPIWYRETEEVAKRAYDAYMHRAGPPEYQPWEQIDERSRAAWTAVIEALTPLYEGDPRDV